MLHTRDSARGLTGGHRISCAILWAALVSLAACGSGDAPTGPVITRTPTTPTAPDAPVTPVTPPATPPTPKPPTGMIAATPTQQVGLARSAAFFAPIVQVFDSLGGYVNGATITCTASRGGVTVVSRTSTESPRGLGFCRDWKLGSSSGDDTLVVSSPGMVPLTFVAIPHDSSYFEIYELKLYAGSSLPFTWLGVGTITSGSYLIAPDGTFRNEEIWSGTSSISSGTYTRAGSELYLGWGTLVISGDTMTFLPSDPIDFDTEVYKRVR